MLESLMLALAIAPQGASVAVLPLQVEGELPERWSEEAEARLAAGLSRGNLSVQATSSTAADCTEPACWKDDAVVSAASFVVAGTLSVGEQRDYALRLDVRSTRTGTVVASVEGTCELCGLQEAVEMIEQRAAVVVPELQRLAGAVPVLTIDSDPSGVTIRIDDRDYGSTPLRVQLPAGPHRVLARKSGYLEQSFEIDAVDGVSKDVRFRLVEAPADPLPRGRGLVIAGAVLLGVGVGGLAAGATLLAVDGEPYRRRCEPDALGTCQFDYETTTGGAVGAALGGAGLVAGAVCLGVGLSRRKRARSGAARLGPTAGGVLLRF